ncbi:MAG: PEGA domain-containing protein [Ignavibacteriae bacterium]|nr:MAG: PEGA domain-containing protein [Ignavibacteriota bacterium]
MINAKKLLLLLLLSNFLLFTGCATLFSGSKDEIDLSSEPSGAQVLVNGADRGKTPLNLRLKKGKEYTIEFVKEGYEKKTWNLTYSIGAGWIILDILSGLIGVIIDAATGNWNSADYDSYKANLEVKSSESK